MHVKSLGQVVAALSLALTLGACGGGSANVGSTPDGSGEEMRKKGVADAGTAVDAGSALDAGSTTTPADAGSTTTTADAGSTPTASADAGSTTADAGSTTTTTSSSTVAGSIPAGLPQRLEVGLFENKGATWMHSSGVKWDMRYLYLTEGWLNNWGWSPADGSYALQYMQESQSAGFIPGMMFYVVNGEPGGGEAQFLAKCQTASTMADYFNQFKVLMQRAKDFGAPVLVMVEGDGWGYMEQQSGTNPNAYAAVAATGMPELANLPNTVAGWGQAFLQLRKSVGASNVILGMDISGWADNSDILYFTTTDDLTPHVNTVYNFLSPLGLGPNSTGATFDVLVNDPLDRDADYYRLTQNQDRWWDPSDTASIDSKSFNRYAEWLRLWNQVSGKRWILWQVPLGNSNSPNINNPDNGTAGGYKDNRTEYFFKDVPAGNTAHLQKFQGSGVIGILFGRGASGQASYDSDIYTDGQLFLKSRAGPWLNAGGMPIQ